MHLNTDPVPPARLPNLLELAQLTSPTGLLPAAVVPLLSPKQLKRRIREINLTHPQYQEETPLVLAYETKRRRRLRGELHLSVNQSKAA